MSTLFLQPKNTLVSIEHVYLFVSVDEEDGNEGVIACSMGPVPLMPMIAADEKRLEQLIPRAEEIAKRTNKPIRLIKLSNREVIRDIKP
jgi:hypothetical protein